MLSHIVFNSCQEQVEILETNLQSSQRMRLFELQNVQELSK
jgi:hypothetical protein